MTGPPCPSELNHRTRPSLSSLLPELTRVLVLWCRNGATGGLSGSDEPNGDECAGWPEGSQEVDLLSGMMQLVVAAVKGYGT